MPVYYDLRPSGLSTAVAGTGADPGYCVVSLDTVTPVAGSNDTITLQAKSSSATVNVGGDTVAFGYAGGSATLNIGSTVDNRNGTYVATAYGVSSASTTTTAITATLNGQPVTTTMPTITVTAGSYAAPNLLNNLSFEEGDSPSHWDGWTNGAGSDPTGVLLDTTQFYTGTQSVQYPWTANGSDSGAAFRFALGASVDELWFRFYMRIASGSVLNSHQKFCIFWAPDGTQLGGWLFNSNDGLTFNFYYDDSSVDGVVVPWASITKDVWHSVECDYQRNGYTVPRAKLYYDGVDQAKADGVDPGTIKGYLWWQSGWLQPQGARVKANQISNGFMVGTRNGGNTGTGTLWLDRIAASSAGRIGP